MMTQRSIPRCFALLLFVAILAAALSACGSSGSATSTTTSPTASTLTKAEFIKKANAICKEGRARREASFNKAYRSAASKGKNGKAVQEEIVVGAIMPPIVRMNEELAQLEPPSGQAKAAKRLVSSFGAEIKRIEAKPLILFTGEGGGFTEGDELALAYGLNECSEV